MQKNRGLVNTTKLSSYTLTYPPLALSTHSLILASNLAGGLVTSFKSEASINQGGAYRVPSFLFNVLEIIQMHNSIQCQKVADKHRIKHTANIFGIYFPLNFEPTVYNITRDIAHEYNGDYWEFYGLSNGGFYMAPHSDAIYQVECENGFEGKLTADALGIAACLYAYSHLSFSNNSKLAEVCGSQYHLLREYMFTHKEATLILSAID